MLAAVPLQDEDDGLGWGPNVSDVPQRVLEDRVDALGRMLVGGISVGGVYAVSREPGKAAVEALFRLWPKAAAVLVHVSAEGSQLTVRAVVAGKGPNVGGKGGELAAVEVKYQSVANKLITYHCMVDVALEFHAPCPSPAASSSSEDDATNGGGGGGDGGGRTEGKAAVARLLGEEDAFFRAFLRATKGEETLLERAVAFPAVGEDGGEEGRFTKVGPNLARVVDVYTPAFYAPSSSSSSTSSSSSSSQHQGQRVRAVQVYGSVGCVACVHEKESDGDGVAALKADCLRSLRDRVHILREEAATELEDGGAAVARDPASLTHALHSPGGGVLRLPRRVLLPYDPASASSMLVADYLMPGEGVAEAVVRMQEALGLPAGVLEEKAVILPELEAAVDGAQQQGHDHDHDHATHAGAAPSLGRISSCNSLSMGLERAPSTSSLLLERGESYGSVGSLLRAGSAGAFDVLGEGQEDEEEGQEDEHGQGHHPVSMDAEEDEEDEEEEEDEHGRAGGAILHAMPPAVAVQELGDKGLIASITSSPQVVVCMLVVGLAMVVGAALLHLEAQGMR